MTIDIGARARHYPDRTAVIDHTDGETVTYGALADRAHSAAARLDGLGVGAGDAVGVVSRNRIEVLSLLWATRRLDATLAPISHRLPPETVATLVERIDPATVLVEDALEDRTDAFASQIEPIEGIDRPAGNGDVRRFNGDRRAPAMYLHTGGTTGVPKVVVIEERQLEWNAITEVAAWGLGRDDVVPVVLPLFHTGGWNLLTVPTLYVGGSVVLHREFDPGTVLASIAEYGATRLFAVAAIFQAIADHDTFASTDLSTLQWAMSGGGPTPPDLMARYRERGVPFTQGYGLTEGGPNNLYVDPDRPDAVKADRVVGRPFPDCEARIVDDSGTPVGIDTVGELELSGPVTADRYLEHEDGTFDGEWVSTGDLASMDRDGDITIEGRVDNMFVSGGENVYPETIERALEAHEAVVAAGVVPAPHARWGQTPVAFVQAADETMPTAADLEAHARERLPGYAVPSRIEFVDDLPLSGPGKLARQELKKRL